MKKLRLLIAKWALNPVKMSADDLTNMLGHDIIKITADETVKATLKYILECSPQVLANIIGENKTLSADMKTALLGVLNSSQPNNAAMYG